MQITREKMSDNNLYVLHSVKNDELQAVTTYKHARTGYTGNCNYS